MSTETLNAGTQYNDWKGQIALDDQDFKGIREYLKNKLSNKDVVIGIDTFFHGESLDRKEKIEVKAYITNEELEGKYKTIKFEIEFSEIESSESTNHIKSPEAFLIPVFLAPLKPLFS